MKETTRSGRSLISANRSETNGKTDPGKTLLTGMLAGILLWTPSFPLLLDHMAQRESVRAGNKRGR
jgi:hypothetical protein